MIKRSFVLTFLLVVWHTGLIAQQIADTTYNPVILNTAYIQGEGPIVYIDEGHNNFHTKDGRYAAFAHLVQRDGYIVKAYKGLFDSKKLEKGKILVISNALNKVNVNRWFLPVFSAFTADEIKIIRDWVFQGGSLFLIADHMPMGGAAADLAAVFGFEFTNGFAFDTTSQDPDYFKRSDHTLVVSSITEGRMPPEKIEQVVSFTGQGFAIPDDATPILIFKNNYINFLPDTAWNFRMTTPSHSLDGWSQGAYKKFGQGRVVAFGEAAMFTAQLAGPEQMRFGMSSDLAKENYQLLLNIIHWLDGLID